MIIEIDKWLPWLLNFHLTANCWLFMVTNISKFSPHNSLAASAVRRTSPSRCGTCNLIVCEMAEYFPGFKEIVANLSSDAFETRTLTGS